MKKYLIVNTGSASKKYALYQGEDQIIFLHLETENGGFVMTEKFNGELVKTVITKGQFDESLDFVMEILINNHKISSYSEVSAIGVRVVAPGLYFLKHRLIDDLYMEKLEDAKEKAPLHMTPILISIKNLKQVFSNTPIYGISDSAFHSTLTDVSRNYGLPKAMAAEHEIYRYGYHGTSVKSIVSKLRKQFGELPEKIIVCHIGGGVSLTAVRKGESVDTTMGFTPLEGLLMATRVGDIDSGAVLYLAEKTGMTTTELRRYFNSKCGLLGVSGQSDDVRDLIALEEKGDKDASLALSLYAYRIKKNIGSYIAVMNGVDLIVFTATIGERSFIMRGKILADMENLGIILDKEINNVTIAEDKEISAKNSPVKVLVLKTDEMSQLAKDTEELIYF
ncbi:MAG: acetate/propionate family kinase [bacterium]